MKASNLKELFLFCDSTLDSRYFECHVRRRFHLLWELYTVPELRIKSEAKAATDPPCSPLPLEGAGFGDKGFHQRTHLTALMIPEGDDRQE